MDISRVSTISYPTVPIGDAATDTDLDPSTPSLLEEQSKRVKFIRTSRRFRKTLLSVLSYSYLSPLLTFSPIAVAAHAAHLGLHTSFGLNLVALIPYAAIIATIPEDLAEMTGPVVGALINVTLGNTPELIVLIIALKKGEMKVVQAAIVSNLGPSCCNG